MIMSRTTKSYRIAALSAHLTLIVWVVMWQLVISPHPHLPPFVVAAAWSLPLLLPLPGILAAKPYTHAWANFILMLYFMHALTILYINPDERILAIVELALTSAAFVSNIHYARYRGRELGLALTKLSEVESKERKELERKKFER